MRQGKCSTCGATPALSTMFHDGQQAYCAACAHRLSAAAAENKQNLQLGQVLDPTICYKCKADNGSTDFSLVGGVPYCATCREALYNRAFPKWLTLTLAGMLLLLVYSYGHGARYFRAGRALYKGEKLIAQRKFAEAAPVLDAALQVAPDCEKCILLFAKAKILSGHPAPAFDRIRRHKNGNFGTNELASEVRNLVKRVKRASDKAQEVNKLVEQNRYAEAGKLAREAQQIYPEDPSWQRAILSLEIGDAFERKDYDTFLALAQKVFELEPGSSLAAAQVASALACKFAVTNDPAWRARAEEALEKARQLSVTPEGKNSFEEYQERILHRLNSRQIITKAEYDRRFRPQQAQEKPKQ